ncbi:hypothetical protein ACF0H5_022296 [Mactra antiquata]
MTPDEYINTDNELIANNEIGENWENELLEAHKSTECEDDENNENSDDMEPATECVINLHQDALTLIEQLKLYCFNKDLMTVFPVFDQAHLMFCVHLNSQLWISFL